MANRNKRLSVADSIRMQRFSSSVEHLPPKDDTSPDPAQTLEEFWPKQRDKISRMSASAFRESTRHQELPLARIKKIMKIEDEVRNQMISAEAPVILAKAAELLIEDLTLRAWLNTRESRRKTIQVLKRPLFPKDPTISRSIRQKGDISMAACSNEMFDFLIDIIPRDTPQSSGCEDTDLLSNMPISNQVDTEASHQTSMPYLLEYGGDDVEQPLADSSQLVQLDDGQLIQATQIGQPMKIVATGGPGINRRFQFIPVNSAVSHGDNHCDGEYHR